MEPTNAESVDLEACRQLSIEWVPVLRALAQQERLLLALLLANRSFSVRELEDVSGMSQQLISYHLKALREAEVVVCSAEGRSNRYSLCCPELGALVSLLDAQAVAVKQTGSTPS